MRGNRYLWKISGLILGAMVVPLSAQLSAWAVTNDGLRPTANYDPGNCSTGGPGFGEVCQTDNATVSFYMDSDDPYALETPDRNAVNDAIADVYQPTALNVSYDSTPAFSGSAETDWVFQEGDPGSGFNGYTWCDDGLFSDACDQHYIRIRGNGFYTSPLVCHEAGHATGLVHGEYASPDAVSNSNSTVMGCMVSGQNGGPGVLRSFQVNNISSTY
jgi:hypothetical protein